ncbi:TM1802 family CRISPR-associated protein [Natrinema sp. 1APR25-10V2]|uniref:TM1802 family CRISPR-associated protein n=1 Tax=Natrinema sp. 1APR25-10V2 TaxID=2951081 RepID=UPI00287BC341|nr:TM1802 family CRISPR-associated protein [Natrinema sp. 1APR25-10V2]
MDVFEEELPDVPITGLRQIQTLYGALAEAEKAAQDSETPTYGVERIYFTPSELDRFVNESESDDGVLVAVKVDLTGETPTYEGVEYQNLSRDIVPRLGHSYYWPGAAIDHSLTHRGSSSGSEINTVVDYCMDRLVRWTNETNKEPAVGSVADAETGHPDGWVIRGLREVGQQDDIRETIESELERFHNGSPLVTSTVKLRLDPADLDEHGNIDQTDWYYPGEIPVLNHAMKARRKEKLAESNVDNPSKGTAACQVTNEETDVFGTAGGPMDLYTVQHAEHFPSFQRKEAWRVHPISARAALLIQSGTAFVEACKTTRNGIGVFTLPYFTSITQERAELLFIALSQLRDQSADKHPMKFVADAIREHGSDEDIDALRFYVMSIENNQGDIRVFNTSPGTTMHTPTRVAEAHQAVLESPLFTDGGLPTSDSGTPLNPQRGVDALVDDIISGWYATTTFCEDEESSDNDIIEHVTFSVLSDTPINETILFDHYVERLVEERNTDYGQSDNSGGSGRGFPHRTVATQFAQYVTLDRAELLDSSRAAVSNVVDDEEDGWNPTYAPMSIHETIEDQLNDFLDARDELRANDELRGAFLFGAYLGVVAQHQSLPTEYGGRGMNYTILDDIVINQLAPVDVESLVTDLVEKDGVYARESDVGTSLARPIKDELMKALTLKQPREWDLPRSQFQFFVTAGEAYGEQVISTAFEANGDDQTETDAQAEAN